MAGKGSFQRPTNHSKFSENYDVIFKSETIDSNKSKIFQGQSVTVSIDVGDGRTVMGSLQGLAPSCNLETGEITLDKHTYKMSNIALCKNTTPVK